MESWVDGQPAGAVPLKDRGLAYGDGLFETIAVKAGQPVLLDRHLQRLDEGCRRLAIVADQPLIRSELLAYAAALGEGVLKLILTRGDSQRGYGISVGAPRDAFCKAVHLPLIPRNMQRQAFACLRVPPVCPSNLCLPASSTSIAWNRYSPAPSGRMPITLKV